MKHKSIRAILVLALIAVVIGSLSNIVVAQSGETTLRIASGPLIATLDPIKSITGADIPIFGQLYSRLLRKNLDGELEAGLAESWEISDDGLQYTFHLRDNTKFSDGSPLTSEDVVFSYLRMRDQEDSAYSGSFQVITDIVALDDKTIQFTLDATNAPFLGNTEIFNTGIVPKKVVQELGDEKFAANPVGSGPYRVREWIPSDRLILEKNPYYWREGYPHIDVVEFIYVPNDATRISMIQAGEADVAADVPFANIQQLTAGGDIVVPSDPSSIIQIILLNHNSELIKDVRVRKAIAMSLDVKTITEVTTMGLAMPANSLIPNTLMYYNPDAPGILYDPEQAKKLIEEAGVTGAEIDFMLVSGDTFTEQLTLLIQDQLTGIGLSPKLTQVNEGAWWDKLIGGEYDATVNWWYNETSDPDLAVRWALCGTCGNFSYYTNFTNDEINQLTEQAVRELDPDKRRDLYYQIQQIALDEVAQVPLFYRPYTHAYRTNVKGLKMTPALQWTLEEATIE